MEKIIYNNLLCNASKNQKSGKYTQCPYQKVNNTLFCGKHKNYLSTKNKQITCYMITNNEHINNIPCDFKKCGLNPDDNDYLLKKNNLSGDIINCINNSKFTNQNSYNINNLIPENINYNDISNNVGDILNGNENNYRLTDYHDRKKSITKTLTTQIGKDYLKIRNNYIRKKVRQYTILDYLSNFNILDKPERINYSFKKYKLKFSNQQITKLTELEIILKNGKNDDKSIIDERKRNILELKQQYMHSTLVSLFETIVIAYLNYDKVIKIQNNFKKYLIHKNIKYRGYGLYCRKLCVNDTDFYSLDTLEDIPNNKFFSYKDARGFVFGFHIDSINELFKKKRGRVKNPYNRDYFSLDVKDKLTYLTSKNNKNIKLDQHKIAFKISVRLKTIDVFTKIDLFGYQTNIDWIYEKSTTTLKYFYKKLSNYWNYRLGLSTQLKRKILPEHDLVLANRNILTSTLDKYKLLDKILNVLDALVSNGEGEDDKNLGSIIILHALSEISDECAASNPWLL
tara:strand:- start:663 stop:2198 length:1536 start_codon:yes stop_codon:yes gene_type:complete